MDDDDFGADAEFLAALAATDVTNAIQSAESRPSHQPTVAHRPTPARIQQPTPQRIERPDTGVRIVQPTPQALSRGSAPAGPRAQVPLSGSSILVSPRQKSNPVLSQLRSVAWEYSDIVADYGLGTTTCALFLSLKYHRLHPEYIYSRIQGLQGKYQLRVLLTLVDIDNHEEPLRELAKTSLVNQVTLLLCWSAAEAARYLEQYKLFEHATSFAAIRGQQASGYAERLVQFATVPRTINKADAVALVSSFGSVRRAVLAEPAQLALVSGFGEKKVQGWRRAVEAPFRVQKAKARRARAVGSSSSSTQPASRRRKEATTASREVKADSAGQKGASAQGKATDEELSEGVATALAQLREKG